MEQTFNEQQTNASSGAELEQQDAQRIQANAQGQQNVPGEAGRAQVGSKDPKEFDTRGGPGGDPKPKQDPVI